MPKPTNRSPKAGVKSPSAAVASSATPLSRSSNASQIFLAAVFVSSLFSLGLNIYLSTKLALIGETNNLQNNMKQAFIQSPRHKPGDHQILTAAEAHAGGLPDDFASKLKAAFAAKAKKKLDLPSDQQGKRGLDTGHDLAGLKCDAYGGPSTDVAQEMVYWEDIPSDASFVSPFKRKDKTQYLTFEPDDGGWNNIRMNMETVLALAFAMGRTLVLPPEKEFYLLSKTKAEHGGEQKKTFSFSHFFHMESIHNEHVGIDIITMTHYLESVAMKGGMVDRYHGGKVRFPPNNRTNWDGATEKELKYLYAYLRETSHTVVWTPEECLAAFPKSHKKDDEWQLHQMVKNMLEEDGVPHWEKYVGHPTPVDGDTLSRLKENWAQRKKLCIYNGIVQQQSSVHFPTDEKLNARLLVHFYAFLFFQDWRHDLWMKRFIRDHVRYIDEIQCAAARVVEALRKRVRERNAESHKGYFHTFHVRRGDFQYKATRVEADVMYRMAKKNLPEGSTVYIATDERNLTFFQPLMNHYDVVFLDDFIGVLGKQVNTNYYGMIDQLVASRGKVFFGCWFSTFTAYINRLRGYHADNHQEPGYKNGIVNSYYYAMEDRYDHMQQFYPVKQAFYAREFPAAWRLIDTSVGDLGLDPPKQ
ncbi:GDP-fucose protein O-fucosyltransferase [Seminavis robusta]|uniref:GDP-fucose protein O-fucosyltransferase n=1 Tax=Seminavis robusta TaxID=568900 RepID=A0A9N8DH86_9STRA|nr:GDP-fucose protein O-fucosyltransferase [Seminavis robusta]|eukprot:Sro142_g066060.1 GDP-fucose protein O-fucosyltransferase (641) ;mRNA; f:14610-16696